MPTAQTASNSIDAQRQLIYASLLRYAPIAVPLRDRIIDQLTTGGLLGSTKESPFTVGVVSSNIFAGSKTSLRVERIQESLSRLAASGLVQYTQSRKKHAYFLLEKGIEQTKQVITSITDLFDASLRRILANTQTLCPYSVGAESCRTFLLECFGRFGVQMAKTVTGQLQPGDLIHQADVRAAFDAAVRGRDLSVEAKQSLYSRCIELLRSMHPDDVLLRYLITQGYYFAQLAEYGTTAFNPLVKESYRGSVYLLDTNVLILSVMEADSKRIFDELTKIAKEMQLQLGVTRATLMETIGVFENRKSQLSQILPKAPETLVKLAHDELVDAYFLARDKSPELTVEEFFDRAITTLSNLPPEWGVELINIDEDAILGDRHFPEAETVMQEEAVNTRRWRKPEATLRHDVAHYAYVLDERLTNQKIWFLTRDRGLPIAAARLAKEGEPPFTFELTGLLETVSPFLTTAEGGENIGEVLGRLVTQNLIPNTPLFNVNELKLLVEMNEDVLSTPADQLIRAVDYVKHSILDGSTYNPSKYNEVALGLKSFIASSAAEQRKELESQRSHIQADLEKQTKVALEERKLRQEKDAVIEAQLQKIADLQASRERQSEELQELKKRTSSQSDQIGSFQQRTRTWFRIMRWVILFSSIVIMLILKTASEWLSGYIQWKSHWSGHWNDLRLFIRFVAAIFPVYTVALFVRIRQDWPLPGKSAVVGITFLLAVFWCDLIDRSTPIYSVAALAVLVGTTVATLVHREMGS